MNPRIRFVCALILALFLAGPQIRAEEPVSSAKALERLKVGNARFVADKSEPKNVSKDRRLELTKGQHPFAVILTCADSRVAPELLFDTGLGDLFVLRVAGNVADPAVLGSIEYAVEHLHATLIIVMGHESCGAVKAAIDGGHLEGNLATLIKMVEVGKDLPKDSTAALATGVKNNVAQQTRLLTQRSTILEEMAQSRRIEIVPAVYSLATGKVEWLETKSVEKESKLKDADSKKATSIKVRVPVADARVWINDTETRSRGLQRNFETPGLTDGKRYSYQIKVVWLENGNEVTREKTVSFLGGEPVELDIKK